MLIELSGARKYQQFIEISTDIGFFFFKNDSALWTHCLLMCWGPSVPCHTTERTCRPGEHCPGKVSGPLPTVEPPNSSHQSTSSFIVSQLTLINQFPNYQKLNKLNRGKSRLTSSLPLLEGFALFVCVVDAGGAFCWGCPFKVGNSVVTPPWLL